VRSVSVASSIPPSNSCALAAPAFFLRTKSLSRCRRRAIFPFRSVTACAFPRWLIMRQPAEPPLFFFLFPSTPLSFFLGPTFSPCQEHRGLSSPLPPPLLSHGSLLAKGDEAILFSLLPSHCCSSSTSRSSIPLFHQHCSTEGWFSANRFPFFCRSSGAQTPLASFLSSHPSERWNCNSFSSLFPPSSYNRSD